MRMRKCHTEIIHENEESKMGQRGCQTTKFVTFPYREQLQTINKMQCKL